MTAELTNPIVARDVLAESGACPDVRKPAMRTSTELDRLVGERSARSANLAIARRGGRDISGIAVGYIPMAMTIGAAISRAPGSAIAGWLGAPLIAAGTAHLTITDIVSTGGSLGAAVLAGFFINARLIAYSAGLATWFGGESRPMRLVIGFFTIDATYLLANQRFRSDDPGTEGRRWYFVGMGVVLWSIWTVAMGVGVVLGRGLPGDLGLEWVATFMLVGLVALNLGDRRHLVSAAIGTIVALAAGGIPGVLLPAIAGAAAIAVAVATPPKASPAAVDEARVGSPLPAPDQEAADQ